MITRQSLMALRDREVTARTKASKDREAVLNQANLEKRDRLSDDQDMKFRNLTRDCLIRDGRIQLIDELLLQVSP